GAGHGRLGKLLRQRRGKSGLDAGCRHRLGKKEYKAGPDPDNAVTASINDSSSSITTVPTADNNVVASETRSAGASAAN
mgnify:CR=1